MSSTPLVLVDGSSYFFRAFHALPPLKNSKGQPTGAIYGVANMIKRLIKDYKPEKIAVVFDAKGKTFRDDLYREYKAHRAPMPDDLSCQFKPLIELLEAMGLPILIIDHVEADDVIGTLAHQAKKEGETVLISTGDKDMAQLVCEHVTLINTMSNQILNVEGVKTKFGVLPEQMIDYLTLIGDSVDNIPGVTKCGPKTAIKWLEEYTNLDQLVEHAHDIKGKIGDYLRQSLNHLPLSKQLVTIKTDVLLPVTLSDLKAKRANHDLLISITQEMEFKSWLKELLETTEGNVEQAPHFALPSFSIITQAQQLLSFISTLKNSTFLCINTETDNQNPIYAQLIGIALATNSANVYIPLKHEGSDEQLSIDFVLSHLKPIFEEAQFSKIGHDLKFDYHVLKRYGIQLNGLIFDTMLESYVLNSSASKHDRNSLALKYLGQKPISYEEIAGKGIKCLSFDQILIDKGAPYAAQTTDIALKLHQKLYEMIEPPVRELFQNIEMPLLPVLAEMESNGVLIDKHTLAKHGERLKLRMNELEKEALILAGKPFNLNSPKQLQEILFENLKIPVLSKTPTGQPSTAESILQELAYEYRLPAVILEYRSLCKLVSTYIEALPRCINPSTGRVHTCYNQAITATGRLSSSEPNLQNIPIRSEEGRLIRKAFIAPDEFLIIAADYSQIELRIMAHLSQDESLVKAFSLGWDIHSATASEIFEVPLEDVTKEQRRRSKAVNFGLIYGMSSFGLAKQLGIERQDAQNYITKYFQRYPKVLEYMERTRQQAHEQGFVETLFGRRLHLPEINTRNMVRQKAAERMAINAPMQGTAADIIKKAMLSLSKLQPQNEKSKLHMIMQVHDELVFEVHQDNVEFAIRDIKELMENATKLSVPLEVSIGVGKNWDEAHS